MTTPIQRDEFTEVEKTVRATDLNVVRLQEQVANMQRTIAELVTKTEFAPVKLIAYGLATAVLSSVIMAVLAKVVMK